MITCEKKDCGSYDTRQFVILGSTHVCLCNKHTRLFDTEMVENLKETFETWVDTICFEGLIKKEAHKKLFENAPKVIKLVEEWLNK